MNRKELQEEIEARLSALEDNSYPLELALAEIMAMIDDYCEDEFNGGV